MGDEVTVQLLGTFSITVDGLTVGLDDFPRRSGAELVQLLALAPGCRRHREQVLHALWPDVGIEISANRLYQAASHARKALVSPDAIVLRGEVVALFPDCDVVVDAAVIEGLDVDDRAALAEALDTYGGELLPDSPYAEWAIEARDRLRERRLELLTEVGRWRSVVEIDPTNENAHVALMQQALEVGDPHETLRRYQVLEGVLAEKLDAVPGEAATAVRDEAERHLSGPARQVAVAGLRAFVVAELDTLRSPSAPGVDAVLTTALEGAGGTVFDTTLNRVSAVFSSVTEAARAAVRCQQAIQGAAWTQDRRPAVCIGIDAGEAERRNGGWSGRIVGRTAAIAAAGSGDQTLCSSLVADLIDADFGDDVRTVDLGLFRLADHPPLAVHRVVTTGTEDRPSPLRVSRLAGRAIGAVGDAILGRETELDELSRQLETARLVTVTGPGGAGKTHLARHVGSRHRDDYSGGVWMCELGSVSDRAGAAQQLLSAIGGQRHTDTTVRESIVRTLGDRPVLVIVDNCEHVLDPVRDMCIEILQRCPETRLLTTSREPLGTRPEVVVPLGELNRQAAVELFVTEARRHGAEVDDTDPAIDRICERLDDLPLAVCLAAARTRVVDVAGVESLLADRFHALRSVERADLAHHQTLRATVAWSVDALDAATRSALIDLSVLANRFSLDAAVAIATRPAMTRGQVLDHFDELVRRSLVSGPARTGDETSYRLLESVRLFARDLQTDGAAADRHFDYFLDRAQASDAMMRDEPDRGRRRLHYDWDDIRRARGHAVDHGRHDHLARLLASVASFATFRLKHEYLQWCEDSLTPIPTTVDTPVLARAMGGWASILMVRGRLNDALDIAQRAYGAYPEDELVAWAIGNTHIWHGGDYELGRAYLEELASDRYGQARYWQVGALGTLTAIGAAKNADTSTYLHRLEVLAANGGSPYQLNLLLARGWQQVWTDPDAALETFDQAMALADRHDLPLGLMGVRTAVSRVEVMFGTLPRALAAVRQALMWFNERGMWTFAVHELRRAATVVDRAGKPDIAITLLSAFDSSQVEERNGVKRDRLKERIGESHPGHIDTWWATGQDLDPPTAVALAIATIESVLTNELPGTPEPAPIER